MAISVKNSNGWLDGETVPARIGSLRAEDWSSVTAAVVQTASPLLWRKTDRHPAHRVCRVPKRLGGGLAIDAQTSSS